MTSEQPDPRTADYFPGNEFPACMLHKMLLGSKASPENISPLSAASTLILQDAGKLWLFIKRSKL